MIPGPPPGIRPGGTVQPEPVDRTLPLFKYPGSRECLMETTQLPLLLVLALAATGLPAADLPAAGPGVDAPAPPLDSLTLTVRRLLAAAPAVAAGESGKAGTMQLAQWSNWSNWMNNSCTSGTWRNC